MTDSIGTIILAAGKGTRLKINHSKVLLPILGRPLIHYIVDEIKNFSDKNQIKNDVGVVVGHFAEEVRAKLSSYQGLKFALQKEQKGTADAVKSFYEELPHMYNHKYTLIVCGDTPLIEANDLEQMWKKINSHPTAVAVVATFMAKNPFGYGRIKKIGKGLNIIEEKDASPEDKKIQEVNSSLYLIKTEHIQKHLQKIQNKNASGEFYLTDLFSSEFEIHSIALNEQNLAGVNTLVQLEEATKILQKRKIIELQNSGVLFYDSQSARVEWNVKIAPGSIIHPQVNLMGNTVIDENVTVESGSIIKNSEIKSHCEILAYCYLENVKIEANCHIGPFARLRPETLIGAKSKIGNFVEIKKSKLAEGVKVSHLSYVGDAIIGKNTNIGCGFITCNYDGANKHVTQIGDDCFIGSDCQTIAPIEIGDRVYVGSGSTINKSIPSDAFAIARARQETKIDMAKRFIKTKK
jgi:bifunctional UDP-N-acetylglucosamine pyrophosphorylase/glucosamine-1-phosphate N-acetyltransferase